MGLRPTSFKLGSDSSGASAVLNGLTLQFGVFSTTTMVFSGPDNRTRLAIWASGITSGMTDADPSTPVLLGNGSTLQNFASSVLVEGRTSNGRLFNLPTEYAGPQGNVAGLDQIVVI